MILVDTCVWADHLRRRDERLGHLLAENGVAIHPLIVAELALGPILDRGRTLQRLAALPTLPTESDPAFLAYCVGRPVIGRGIGVIDVHLLMAAERHGATLWTRDRRLADAARDFDLPIDFS